MWLPLQRLLDQLLSDMQSHLDKMEKMCTMLVDTYPLFWASHRSNGTGYRPQHVWPKKPAYDNEGSSYLFSSIVASFAPEELLVQLQGWRLMVCAKHDHCSEAADGCISHEYCKPWLVSHSYIKRTKHVQKQK
ncbi:UNVERIFIED_CONTAM: hypothetical protein K2H54_058382 [Gekko kuhli]